MPTLYEILKKKELSKYPPLPDYVAKSLKSMKPGTDEYVEYTSKIAYDDLGGGWIGLRYDD
jgi:hypothetical protein